MENNIKRLKAIILFLFVMIQFGNSYAQNEHKVDSVLQIISTAKHDSIKILQYNVLSAYVRNKDANRAVMYAQKSLEASKTCNCPYYEAYSKDAMGLSYQMITEYDTAILFFKEALSIRKEIKDSLGIGTSLNDIGVGYYYQAKYKEATNYFEQSAVIKEKIGDSLGAAQSLNNTGIMFDIAGNPLKAIDKYLKALAIYEKLNNKSMMIGTYQNIALIYMGQENNDEAEKYLNNSLELAKELNDKNALASSYDNLGVVYDAKKEYLKAYEYFKLALKNGEEVGNDASIGRSYSNLAINLEYQGKFEEALEFHQKALKLKEKTGNLASLSITQIGVGDLYRKLGQHSKAISFYVKGLENAESSGYIEYVKQGHNGLAQTYSIQGKYKKAYWHLEQFMVIKDSVLNIDNSRMITDMESKYQNEKKELEIEKLEAKNQLKEEEIARNEIEIEHEKVVSKQRATQLYGSLIGLVLVLVLLAIAFKAYKNKRLANEIISKQKEEVEHQKEEIEEQHKEITDSINYAKRIQAAILPPARIVKEYLQNSFILYKPKDVVAGDFYWMERVENTILFAAADCTGHGVPGAMVSVVCHNALNRAVKEFGLIDPGSILDKTRDIVVAEFEKSDEEVKDGMDIALCSLEIDSENLKSQISNSKLSYAGANNPLWIVRDNEVIETKATKQPIGKFDKPMPFETHFFDLQENDAFYIFSDGMVDQFGGEKGKKFKSKTFKDLLLTIQNESMTKQKELINDVFENWRGDLEQIDDVCIIGVRV